MKFIVVASLFSLALVVSREASGQEATSEVLIPRGSHELKAYVFEARGDGPFPCTILLQGIPGGESDVLGLGRKLSEAGIHALTFNYTGTHGSGGQWNSFANDEDDVRAVLDHVHGENFAKHYDIDTTQVCLGGYSHGGGLALLYASRHASVQKVFSIVGNDFAALGRRALQDASFREAVDHWFTDYFSRKWLRPPEGTQPQWGFLDHLGEVDVAAQARHLASKSLFLAGGLDDGTTPLEDHVLPLYRALERASATDVRLVVYQTGHDFSGSSDAMAQDLIDWIRSDMPGSAAAGSEPGVGRGKEAAMLSLDVKGDAIFLHHFAPYEQDSNRASMLLIPGWPAVGKDILGLGSALSGRGTHVFVIQPRGHGSSGGKATFANALEDVATSWRWLASEDAVEQFGLDPDRRSLAGYSWGGGIALAFAAQDTSVARVVSIAGTDHGVFIRRVDRDPEYGAFYRRALESTQAPGGPVRFDVDADFSELRNSQMIHDLATIAPRLATRDLLIVTGLDDDQVELEHQILPFYRALRASGSERVRVLTFHDGHGFARVRESLADEIHDWLLNGRS